MDMKEEDQKDISLIEAKRVHGIQKIMVRWAGESVDVYANKIKQLAGFQGAGLERFTNLVFVTGFPNAISIDLQQAPKIEPWPWEIC